MAAAILASDSRFSFGTESYEDDGRKVWALLDECPVGAVYAGDVRCAEEALKKCQRRLRLARPKPTVIGEVVQGSLQEVYAAHKAKRSDKVGDLQVLVAVFGTDGAPHVLRLESRNDFTPHETDGLQAIGSGGRVFEERFTKAEEALWNDPSTVWKLDVDEWAGRLVATLFADVIEPGIDKAVGGGVQVRLIDRKGWSKPVIDRLRSPKEVRWERISADPDDMKVFTEEQGLPPLAP